MKKIILALAAFSALLFSSCTKSDENGWYDDLDAAKKACGKRSILLVVTSMYDNEGTDKGIETLTGTPDFAEAVKDSYVCLHFDMSEAAEVAGPAADNITDKEQKARDKAKAVYMKKSFILDCIGISETPSAAILSKEGYFITEPEFDFTGDNIDAYISSLKLEDSAVTEMNNKIALTKKGSAASRIDAIDEIYESITESQRLLMTDLCRKALSLDKKNETGKAGKYVTAVAHADAYDCMIKRDFGGAVNVYRTSAKDSRLTPEESQSLYIIAITFMMNTGYANNDIATVKAVLQEGYDAGPETQFAPLFKNALDGITSREAAETTDNASAQEK